MKRRRTLLGIASLLAWALFAGSLAMVPAAPATAAPFAYVTNAFAGGTSVADVTVVDVATGMVVATVPTGSLTTPSGNTAPFLVAVSPDGQHAYVTCDCSSFPPAGTSPGTHAPILSVIDAATNAVTQVYGPSDAADFSDAGALGLAVTPDGSRAYVAASAYFNLNPFVLVIDTNPASPTYNTALAMMAAPGGSFDTPPAKPGDHAGWQPRLCDAI